MKTKSLKRKSPETAVTVRGFRNSTNHNFESRRYFMNTNIIEAKYNGQKSVKSVNKKSIFLFKLAYSSKTKPKTLSVDLPIEQISELANQVSGSVIKFSRVEVQS